MLQRFAAGIKQRRVIEIGAKNKADAYRRGVHPILPVVDAIRNVAGAAQRDNCGS